MIKRGVECEHFWSTVQSTLLHRSIVMRFGDEELLGVAERKAEMFQW